MKKQYLKSNIFGDEYVSFNGKTTKITTLLTIEHMQIVKKSFYVKGLEKEYKPYYYLSLAIGFEFEIKKKNNISIIYLQDIRTSVIGVEKDIGTSEKQNYEEYSIKESFGDYIKRNYKEKIDNLKQVNIQGSFTTYEIQEIDLIKIKETIKYVEKLLENENEITVLNDMGVKFNTTDSLQKGLDIYKGYSILRNMEELKEETIKKSCNNKKRNKI